jgi:hypothetical protein
MSSSENLRATQKPQPLQGFFLILLFLNLILSYGIVKDARLV